MRNVQLQDADQELNQLAEEAEAAKPVTLLRGDRPVAQIIPFPKTKQKVALEEQRLEVREELLVILQRGFNLGGLRIENRDELYDREYGDESPVHD